MCSDVCGQYHSIAGRAQHGENRWHKALRLISSKVAKRVQIPPVVAANWRTAGLKLKVLPPQSSWHRLTVPGPPEGVNLDCVPAHTEVNRGIFAAQPCHCFSDHNFAAPSVYSRRSRVHSIATPPRQGLEIDSELADLKIEGLVGSIAGERRDPFLSEAKP